MAGRAPPPALTAKEERVVLNLLQQGKSNLAVINHFTTQEMELTLEQVCDLPSSKGAFCAHWRRMLNSPHCRADNLF